MSDDARTARLYLIAPRTSAAVDIDAFTATLDAADIACVLFPNPAPDFAAHAAAAQRAGIAVLVPAEEAHGTAFPHDGYHLDGMLAELAALRAAGGDAIVGFGGVSRRHDGMMAGETGADYVAIGRLLTDDPLPLADREDLLAWWQALMEVPCVSHAESAEDVTRLVRAGADFVAVGALVWSAPDGPAAAVAALGERLDAGLQPA